MKKNQHSTALILEHSRSTWTHRCLICLLGLCTWGVISADETDIPWDKLFTELSERATDEATLERWSEELLERAEHPLALNQATQESLEALPFLSANQVEALSYYLYRYGPMEDLSELALIEGLDASTIELLQPFVCLGNTQQEANSQPVTLRYGKHSLRSFTGRTVETKSGYEKDPEKQGYRGDQWTQTLRYTFNVKQRIRAGITLQKDAGEPWLVRGRWPDYSAMHLLINDIGPINTTLVGDFSLSLGQGLVCGQGFQLGKSLTEINTSRNRTTLRRHASSAETGFFRGTALEATLVERQQGRLTTFRLNGLLFVGRQKMDGRVEGDTIRALLTTGLHRTREEQSTRKNAPIWTAGGRLGLSVLHGSLHANILLWNMEKPLEPTRQPYNQFVIPGQSGANLSLDGRWYLKPFTGFAELAISRKGHTACLAGFDSSLGSNLNMSLLYRRYERGYHALFGQAFGEHEAVNNEEGLYLIVGWEIGPHLTIHANADTYRFPWLTYTTDEPASGYETGLLATWHWGTYREASLRAKCKTQEKNKLGTTCKTPHLETETKNSLRAQYQETSRNWQLTSTLATAYLLSETQPLLTSVVFTQALRRRWIKPTLHITGSLSWFDVSDYAVRISHYEPGLPGTFSMPVFEGRGCRWLMMLSVTPSSTIDLWLKIGQWLYADSAVIGTGLEQIAGRQKTDIQLMVQVNFGKRVHQTAKKWLPL